MENDIKVVYVQVDKNSMNSPTSRHFIYSSEVELLKNLTSTFSESCLEFKDFPGMSTYQTCEQQDIINLCTIIFDKIVFLENEITPCKSFLNSVEEYENAK